MAGVTVGALFVVSAGEDDGDPDDEHAARTAINRLAPV